MTAPRIPRIRRAQVVGLPRTSANDPRWPSTMFVGELPRPYRPAPRQRVGIVAWLVAKVWAGLILCAFGLGIASAAYLLTSPPVLTALDSLAVAMLRFMGVV